MLIYPVSGYIEAMIKERPELFIKSQSRVWAEEKQQVASTQYGSKTIHLFLDTNPGSQHIISHSAFIYLHLCFPSERSFSDLLLQDSLVSQKVPKRSLGR